MVNLQQVRKVLRFGSAQDPRMPLANNGAFGNLADSSPEVQLVQRLRFQWRAFEHVTVAFEEAWGLCVPSVVVVASHCSGQHNLPGDLGADIYFAAGKTHWPPAP
jgi:hypothetical protein